MKKAILLLLSVILINISVNAQYKINNNKYDYKTYKYQNGDPYNPTISGFASFLIPGIGQISSGETGRGAAFFGGFVGCAAIFTIGANTYYADENGVHGGPGLLYLGFFGAIVVDLISVTDAVRVAKVNDLAFRDKDKTGFNLQISPFFGTNKDEKIPLGLSFKVQF
jgi:hypothetical protein